MKTLNFIIVLFFLGLQGIQAQEEDPNPIPGQYIVILKESAATPVALQKTFSENREQSAMLDQPKRDANLNKLAQIQQTASIGQEKVLAEFADVLVGFTATLSEAEVAQLAAHPDVEGVYQDYYLELEPQSEEAPPEEYEESGQTVPCAILNAGGFVE